MTSRSRDAATLKELGQDNMRDLFAEESPADRHNIVADKVEQGERASYSIDRCRRCGKAGVDLTDERYRPTTGARTDSMHGVPDKR